MSVNVFILKKLDRFTKKGIYVRQNPSELFGKVKKIYEAERYRCIVNIFFLFGVVWRQLLFCGFFVFKQRSVRFGPLVFGRNVL
jgi:hypothetical protein